MFCFLEKYLNNYFRELFDVTLRLLVNLTNPELLLFKVFSNIRFRGIYFLKMLFPRWVCNSFTKKVTMLARSGKKKLGLYSQNKGENK